MQDRFKFRFWITYFDDDINKSESVMQYSDNLDSENSASYLFYNNDDVVIQQSTGLKDKNNKLIYEEDIVKDLTYSHNMLYICKDMPILGGLSLVRNNEYKKYMYCKENWDYYYIKDEIRHKDNRFLLANEGNHLHCFNMKENVLNDLEVIGNIYENPELLEVNNG